MDGIAERLELRRILVVKEQNLGSEAMNQAVPPAHILSGLVLGACALLRVGAVSGDLLFTRHVDLYCFMVERPPAIPRLRQRSAPHIAGDEYAYSDVSRS